jgi:pyrimidine operon attenuation protein / uracil phosphoribosyltransferase
VSDTLDLDVGRLLESMAAELAPMVRDSAHPVKMVGICTGGVWVAKRLHKSLGLDSSLGELNINFYRDDFTQVGMHPLVSPSNLPFSVEGCHVILVDDVLYTGRTIRAALNELFDFGRPARVTLAVLAERLGRELPISANVVGKHVSLEPGQYVKLAGPEPLELALASSIVSRN